GGPAYGSMFENDPNNKINWANDNSFNCTWTGAADTDWTNPANWSSCTNGRGNYPDQLDSAVIPVTANQPVINLSASLHNFGTGTGGGTVTIGNWVALSIVAPTSSFRSDVKLQGSTTTCNICYVFGMSSLGITDGATLTLLKGIIVRPNQMMGIYV